MSDLWLPKEFSQKLKESSVREESAAVDPYHITGVSPVLSVGCCTCDNFVHLDFQLLQLELSDLSLSVLCATQCQWLPGFVSSSQSDPALIEVVNVTRVN